MLKKRVLIISLVMTLLFTNIVGCYRVASANPFIGLAPEVIETVATISCPEYALVALMVMGFGIVATPLSFDMKQLGDDVRSLGKKTEESILKFLETKEAQDKAYVQGNAENRKELESFLDGMCKGVIKTSSKGFKMIKLYVDSVLNPADDELIIHANTEEVRPLVINPPNNEFTQLASVKLRKSDYYWNEEDNREYINAGNKAILSVQANSSAELKKFFKDNHIGVYMVKNMNAANDFYIEIIWSYGSKLYRNGDALINALRADDKLTEDVRNMLRSFYLDMHMSEDDGSIKTWRKRTKYLFNSSPNDGLGAFINGCWIYNMFSDWFVEWVNTSVIGGVSDVIIDLPQINESDYAQSIDITDVPDIPEEYDTSKAKDTDLTKAREEDLTDDIPVPMDITDETLPSVIPKWIDAESLVVIDYPDTINPEPNKPNPDDPEQNPSDKELNEPDEPLKNYTFDLRKLFPFCLPFDLYEIIKLFDAEPKAPKFIWKFPIPLKEGGCKYIDLELNLKQFDPVAKLVRGLMDILVIVGLIYSTRSRFLRG